MVVAAVTRFVVTSVTGWIIRPGAGNVGERWQTTTWYVNDSAYCHRTVAVYDGRHGEAHARHDARMRNLCDQYDEWASA